MVNTWYGGVILLFFYTLEMVIIKVHKILLKITLKTVATWNLFSYKAACRKQKAKCYPYSVLNSATLDTKRN